MLGGAPAVLADVGIDEDVVVVESVEVVPVVPDESVATSPASRSTTFGLNANHVGRIPCSPVTKRRVFGSLDANRRICSRRRSTSTYARVIMCAAFARVAGSTPGVERSA